MPQVPEYRPVPGVEPTLQGQPGMRVDSPLEAFGGGMGQSLSRLGAQLERSADELYGRAVAMQQLDNDAVAKERLTAYEIEQSQLQEKFLNLRGDQAKTALPQHLQAMQQLRQKYRDGLPNDDTKKRFDGPSLTYFGRDTINSRGHAATQFRNYVSGTNDARIKLSQANAGKFWKDPEAFKEAQQQIEFEVESKAAIEGWSKEQMQAYKTQQISLAWYNKLSAQSLTQPFEAWGEYEANKDKLGEHRLRLETQLEQRIATNGPKQLLDQLTASDDYEVITERKESGGRGGSRSNAQAKTSSAYGSFQFTVGKNTGGTGGTWAEVRKKHPELDLPESIYDADYETQRKAFRAFTKDNEDYLRERGHEINNRNRYLAHFMGAAGADHFLKGLKENPAQPAINLMLDKRAAGANRTIFYNREGAPKTAEQVYRQLTAAYGGAGPVTRESGGEWLKQTLQAVEDYADAVAPDNPYIKENARQQVQNRYNRAKGMIRAEDTENFQALQEVIGGGGDPTKQINDLNTILSDPTLSERYFALPADKQARLRTQIDRQATASPPNTPERAQRLQQILNTRYSAPDQFSQIDPWELQSQGLITTQGATAISAAQRGLAKTIQQSTETSGRIRSQSAAIMAAEKIKPGTPEETQFIGAMTAWAMDFTKERQKPPTNQEIRDEAARQVTKVYSEGWWGTVQSIFGGGTARYEVPKTFIETYKPLMKGLAPDKADPSLQELTSLFHFSREISPAFQTKHGRDPSPAEIMKAWAYSRKNPRWREELK